MKKTLTFIAFIVLSFIAKSQEIPIDIVERINRVEYIFEGIVLDSKSYYSDNDKFIRTSNFVQITKVLKGNLTCGTVEIITNGGIIDNKELSISHSLELHKNNMGIFLCDLTNRPLSIIDLHSETNIEKLEGKFENQSFIQYWWDGQQIKASDVWANYDSLALVYNILEQISGYNFIDCSNQSQSIVESYFPTKSHNSISSVNDSVISYYPKVLVGGINDTLTITGYGFGTTKGYALLPNADKGGGAHQILIDDEEISVWNDSIIKFVIPSYARAFDTTNQTGKPAGSGLLEVYNDFLQIILKDSIIIEYSIKNHQDKFPCLIAPWQEMNKKFTFRCDTAVANYDNGKMKIVIEKALNDWKCLTGIDWELGADTIYPGSISLEDQTNTIIFNDYPDSVATLAGTSVRLSKEINFNSTDSSYQIYETDIRINSNEIWFCDTVKTDTVPDGEIDLYAVILHELGHAHGLNHVINKNAVMYYSNNTTERIVNLSNDLSSDKGGNWIANFTNDNNSPMYRVESEKMIFDTLRPCSRVLSILEFTKNEQIDLTIFPNPCSYQLNIQFKDYINEPIQIKVYNTNGKMLSNQDVKNANGHIEDISSFMNGIYIIRVFSKQGEFLGASKFIKQ